MKYEVRGRKWTGRQFNEQPLSVEHAGGGRGGEWGEKGGILGDMGSGIFGLDIGGIGLEDCLEDLGAEV